MRDEHNLLWLAHEYLAARGGLCHDGFTFRLHPGLVFVLQFSHT
jgi:hypothetical protein